MASGFPFPAVSLDVDGTLYDLAWMKIRVALKMPFQLSFLSDFSSVRESLRARGERVDDFRAAQRDLLAQRLGREPEQVGARIETVVYERLPAVYGKAKPYPGLRAALEALVDQGVRLAVCSDYPATEKLEGLGLADLPWAALVIGEEVGALKPHPASFEVLSERLGLPAEQILHVGDRVDCDVDGARAAGLEAALFAPGGSAEGGAKVVFSRWDRFSDQVRRAFA